MPFNEYLRSLLVSFLFSTRNEMHKLQLETNGLKGEALKEALAKADLAEETYFAAGSLVECFDTHEEETIEDIKQAPNVIKALLDLASTPVDSNVPALPQCDDCLQTLKDWAGE